jgi:hypothetical protein
MDNSVHRWVADWKHYRYSFRPGQSAVATDAVKTDPEQEPPTTAGLLSPKTRTRGAFAATSHASPAGAGSTAGPFAPARPATTRRVVLIDLPRPANRCHEASRPRLCCVRSGRFSCGWGAYAPAPTGSPRSTRPKAAQNQSRWRCQARSMPQHRCRECSPIQQRHPSLAGTKQNKPRIHGFPGWERMRSGSPRLPAGCLERECCLAWQTDLQSRFVGQSHEFRSQPAESSRFGGGCGVPPRKRKKNADLPAGVFLVSTRTRQVVRRTSLRTLAFFRSESPLRPLIQHLAHTPTAPPFRIPAYFKATLPVIDSSSARILRTVFVPEPSGRLG